MFRSSQPRYKLIDPTKSSKKLTVWIFLWRSYPPISGHPSREIYFEIRKFTSNCSKRKDSGNITWEKNLEQLFGFNDPFKGSFFSGCWSKPQQNESWEIGSKLVYSKWNVQSLTRVQLVQAECEYAEQRVIFSRNVNTLNPIRSIPSDQGISWANGNNVENK